MRRNALLVVAAALLATLALFLSYFSSLRTGVFGPGPSLLNLVQQVIVPPSGQISPMELTIVSVYVPVFLGTLLLIVGGGLVYTGGRGAYLLSLSGAVISLTFLLWDFTFLQSAFAQVPTVQGRESLITVVSGYGSGYWLAVIGCAVGFVGAVLGWRALRTRTITTTEPVRGQPPGWTLRVKLETVLIFCGGLMIAIGFFVGPFLKAHGAQESLFGLSQEPHQAFLFWPDILAALLLLAGGVSALSGRKGAYLGSWIGALACLTFLWAFFALHGGFTPSFPVGAGFLLTLLGGLLGGSGALLGLRVRPAAPMSASAVMLSSAP